MPYKDPQKRRENHRRWYEAHRESVVARVRRWEKEHKERVREHKRRWRRKNRERLRDRRRRYLQSWRARNQGKQKEYDRRYSERHREELNERNRLWREGHPEAYRESYKRRDQRRLSTSQGKLASNVRRQIHRALKQGGIAKPGRTFDLLGYSLDQLRAHLEAKFLPGMTWSNYGKWHIDHVIPKSWFKYDSVDEFAFKVCWSLWNLEPRWALDNLRKRDKCVGRNNGASVVVQTPEQLSGFLQGLGGIIPSCDCRACSPHVAQ